VFIRDYRLIGIDGNRAGQPAPQISDNDDKCEDNDETNTHNDSQYNDPGCHTCQQCHHTLPSSRPSLSPPQGQ